VRVTLQASKMVKGSTVQTPTIFSTAQQNRPSAVTGGPSFWSEEAHPGVSPSVMDPFNFESFELVRNFIEHMVAANRSALLGNRRSFRNDIDWPALESFVADCRSCEQAIGRAVVIADQMCRGVFDGSDSGDVSSSLKSEDPFFAFSMADVDPDFGDESRYRTRMAKRVARLLRLRPSAVAPTSRVHSGPFRVDLAAAQEQP
jgi:hypothetical protein